eukprot:scaffold3.g6439.t1
MAGVQALFARGLSTSAAALAAPAVAKRGLLASIFSSGSRVTTPLTEPFPCELPPSAVPAEAPKTELTMLANGVKIASEETPGATATLGIYVDSGSVYETPFNAGASHLLEYMAFKTTRHRTHVRLCREVDAIGANVLASASREQMAYNVDTSKVTIPEALELLADAVVNPKFQSWEVAEQVKKMEADVKNLRDNPQTYLLEGLHSVAYKGALGHPLVAPEGSLSHLSADALAEFYATNYTAPRMVLAGGPGKGMHSRLYARVLNQAPWVHNCTAFNSIYNNTGLVGIFASSESERAGDMVDILTKEIQAVAKDVPEVELERAKAAAISNVLMNLESRAVLTYGHRKPVDEFVNEMAALRPADVAGLVARLLKTPPSLAALGELTGLPRYDVLARRFG